MLTLDLINEAGRLEDEVSRILSRGSSARTNSPALNVWASESELKITAELPGIDPRQVDISLSGEELTLRGEFPRSELKEGEHWIRQEHVPYAFSRTVKLPFRVESEKVSAEYANGILSLTLPRAEAEKARKIQIQAG